MYTKFGDAGFASSTSYLTMKIYSYLYILDTRNINTNLINRNGTVNCGSSLNLVHIGKHFASDRFFYASGVVEDVNLQPSSAKKILDECFVKELMPSNLVSNLVVMLPDKK